MMKNNMTSEIKLKIFMMRERGESFKDIAKEIGGISAYDASNAVVDVRIARKTFLEKEKVVYRKRMKTSQNDHGKLVEHMRALRTNVIKA